MDLSNVERIAIGFGNRTDNDRLAGGTGVVYFDDIRLYRRGRVAPIGDLDNDGTVDLADLKIMADEWLHSGDVVADLHQDNKVDFKDYAILASSWTK